MSKGPCKGKCPEYNVEINKDGTLTFIGVVNTKYDGIKSIALSRDEFKTIKKSFKKVKLGELAGVYDQHIYDYPTTIIKDKNNKVEFRREQSVSKELADLIKQIDNLLIEKNLLNQKQ